MAPHAGYDFDSCMAFAEMDRHYPADPERDKGRRRGGSYRAADIESYMEDEMKAPERIWLQIGDGYYEEHGDEMTWCEEQQEDSDIEYIRVDVIDRLEAEKAELVKALTEAKGVVDNCAMYDGPDDYSEDQDVLVEIRAMIDAALAKAKEQSA